MLVQTKSGREFEYVVGGESSAALTPVSASTNACVRTRVTPTLGATSLS
jgi:hypothetical protein